MSSDRFPVDFSTPGTFNRDDYYAQFAELRSHDEQSRSTPTALALSLATPTSARSAATRLASARREASFANDPIREGGTIEGSIPHLDPLRHVEYRWLPNRELTGRAVGRMEERVRARRPRCRD